MNDYTHYSDVLDGACPFGGNTLGGTYTSKPTLSDWYPDRLRVEQLHRDGAAANPLADFDSPAAFSAIGFDELKADIKAMLTRHPRVLLAPARSGALGTLGCGVIGHPKGTEAGSRRDPASMCVGASGLRRRSRARSTAAQTVSHG